MDTHLGLPKIVTDLISSENVNFGGNLRWKVVCDNNFTQVTLTWDKAGAKNSPYIPVYHDQVNHRYGHGSNQNNRYNNALYRRKSPSEIRRDQHRKIQFLQKRLQNGDRKRGESSNGQSVNDQDDPPIVNSMPVADTNERQNKKTSPIACVSTDTVPTKYVPKSNVKTRSMAKQEDSQIETPRNMSSASPAMVMSSPSTVSNDTLLSCGDTESLASVCDNPHNDQDLCEKVPKYDSSDSESESDDPDPTMAPGCYNDECSYGGGPGSRTTGITVYECAKCGTDVCLQCYEEGTAHSGHRKYLRLTDS